MKNIITAIVLGAIVIGVSAVNASAWNHGGSRMVGDYGMMNRGGAAYNDTVSQKLLDETRDIKINLAADQAELNALVSGTNPDSKRVRELSVNIASNQLTLEDKYRDYGYGGHMNGNYMMGSGMMNGGHGRCQW